MGLGDWSNVANGLCGRNAVFAVFAEPEHMTDAFQQTRFLGTCCGFGLAALVKRALEWTVSIYESALGVAGTVLE